MRIDHPGHAQIPQLLAVWKQAFGDHGGFWETFLETGFDPQSCRCVLLDGQAAAALCWFDGYCGSQKTAYLYAVVTHPGYRNRGLCRRLLEDVHAHLSQKGYASSMLVPEQPALRRMYEKLGYRSCTRVSEISCTAAEAPIPIRTIGPEEYARLRREFLPEGGVIQEGRTLSFLASQARFFTGGEFLLAAYQEEDLLHGMELLGNEALAPAILRALDCKRGHFRIPGKEREFAMFHPLTEYAVRPRYFGFAFD